MSAISIYFLTTDKVWHGGITLQRYLKHIQMDNLKILPMAWISASVIFPETSTNFRNDLNFGAARIRSVESTRQRSKTRLLITAKLWSWLWSFNDRDAELSNCYVPIADMRTKSQINNTACRTIHVCVLQAG